MKKKEVVLHYCHGIFLDTFERAEFLRFGVLEGFRKTQPLLDYFLDAGYVVTILTDVHNLDFPDNINIKIVKNISEAFDYFNVSKPSIGIVWNGSDSSDLFFINWLRSIGSKVLLLEYGFYPQSTHIRVTTGGVLSSADPAPAELYDAITPNEVNGFLAELRYDFFGNHIEDHDSSVLVLQTDMDSSVVLGSPFPYMENFIRYLKGVNFNFEDLSVRFHPKMPSGTVQHLESILGEIRRDTSSVNDSLLQNNFFIGINSTMLYEAALLGRRVVNFGFVSSPDFGSFYSGLEFINSGFDNGYWIRNSYKRDKNIYFVYRYKQFNVNKPLDPYCIRYLESVIH
jgi:hypothetical protein